MQLSSSELEIQPINLRPQLSLLGYKYRALLLVLSTVVVLFLSSMMIPLSALRGEGPILVDGFLWLSELLLAPFQGSAAEWTLTSFHQARISLTVVLVTLAYAVPATTVFLLGRSLASDAQRLIIWSWALIFVTALTIPLPLLPSF